MFYKIKIHSDGFTSAIFTKGSGFYILERPISTDLMYFNANTDMFYYLDNTLYSPKEILDLFEQAEVEEKQIANVPSTENTVSEDFALKMLSIAMNKEKFKDVQV